MAEVLFLPSSSGSSPSRQSTDSANAAADCDAEESGRGEERRDGDQLSFLALLFTIFRKSLACRSGRRQFCSMEIGWPNEVRHVAHVTFDRFNGFLGLPVEFEPEVPRRAPSASARVFGVSTESMQLSYDSRGNIVPMILLLMQQSLYDGGGLQVEGIFRITGDNVQEEYIRDQLNRGVVPDGIDVHCLAGLIKAWFRELPSGVLDSVQPDRIIQCSTEEECAELVKDLPQTEAYLLDWAINLMADVAQMEHFNKMNARNIAMVFAPNMTQMADPFTALMYAVQVMNFLKTLVARNLRLREAVIEPEQPSIPEPFDENGHESPSKLCISEENLHDNEDSGNAYLDEEPSLESLMDSDENNNTVSRLPSFHSSSASAESRVSVVSCGSEAKMVEESPKSKGHRNCHQHLPLSDITSKQMEVTGAAMSSLSRIEMRMARIEAWR